MNHSEYVNDEGLLRSLVGRHVRYIGRNHQVTDVLWDDGLLILSADDDMEVQDDSYGRPHRMVPQQQSLQIRDAEGNPSQIWQDLVFLDGPM